MRLSTVALVIPAPIMLAIGLAGHFSQEPVKRPGPTARPQVNFNRRTCPDHNLVEYFKPDTIPKILLSVGDSLEIPEFHDCQRLVFDSAKSLSYGPHVAVFRLDGPHSAGAAAAAVIWNLDGPTMPYPGLNITTRFACLFVDQARDGQYARIVPAASTDQCPNLASNPGQPLWVKVDPTGGHPSDFPDVARWDFDPANRRHNIGVKCGAAAWCEVGLDASIQTSPILPVSSNRIQGRVSRIKGWFDQQWLAEPPGPGHPTWHPGPVLGTLYPDRDLDTYAHGAFPKDQWVRVAVVKLSAASKTYQEKLNLWPGENQIEYCDGVWSSTCRTQANDPAAPTSEPLCTNSSLSKGWWARITPLKGVAPARYYCVERTIHQQVSLPHAFIPVPGTARWQWLDDDELGWTQCGLACCKVKS